MAAPAIPAGYGPLRYAAIRMRSASPTIPVLLLATAFGCATTKSSPTEEFAKVLEGEWGWTNTEHTCEANPHRFRFDLPQNQLILTYSSPIQDFKFAEIVESTYDILEIDLMTASMLLSLHGETRIGSFGDLVVWRLRIVGIDDRLGYVWERPDQPDIGWGPIERCGV